MKTFEDMILDFKKRNLWRSKTEEKARILRASLPPDLIDELISIGFSTKAKSIANKRHNEARREPNKVWRVNAAEEFAKINRNLMVRDAKVEAFDRIVEMLDHMKVGNKLLGDCTRADLLRAAVQAQDQAGEWGLRASLYKQLAGMVGTGTVREASNRGQIVALLTTTFKEPA